MQILHELHIVIYSLNVFLNSFSIIINWQNFFATVKCTYNSELLIKKKKSWNGEVDQCIYSVNPPPFIFNPWVGGWGGGRLRLKKS